MTDEPKTSEQPSGHLRWVTPPETTTKPPRLQQLWYITTYRGLEVSQVEEWRDVPFEALDEFKSELPRVHKSELPKHALDNLLAHFSPR